MPSNTRDWLHFEGTPQHLFNPLDQTWVTTYYRDEKVQGEQGTASWQKEEWLIRSALVAPSYASSAARRMWTHDLEFAPWWDEDKFDFGTKKKAHGITIYPWIQTYQHPVTAQMEMRLRDDFIRYHALIQNSDTEWVHPVDSSPVVRITIQEHSFAAPFPCILVYRKYLLDYLAAMNMCLVTCTVADRFVSRESTESIGIGTLSEEPVAKWTRLSTNYVEVWGQSDSIKTGRGTLIRNHVCRPTRPPKIQDSPWPSFSSNVCDAPSPLFIVDDEGTRVPLERATPLYLFFKPEVLQRHLIDDGYGVFFHMRSWGRAWHPIARIGVDVGINSEGLIVAFTKDLRDLRLSDQNHWAAFSTNPRGDLCREMFMTRMQNSPPHSPGTIALLEEARGALQQAFNSKFCAQLFRDHSLSERARMRLSIGPVREDGAELCSVAKDAYIWLVDTLSKKSLAPHTGLTGKELKDMGNATIRLFQEALCHAGLGDEPATHLCDAFRALRHLRLADAHSVGHAIAKACTTLGLEQSIGTRSLWFALIDALEGSFRQASTAFSTQTG